MQILLKQIQVSLGFNLIYMSEFNFGSLATTQAVSNAKQYLKPWDIYPVEFTEARIEKYNGKKDPDTVYQVLKVRFDGEDGFYEESIFYPKPDDIKRPKYTSKEGHEYEAASQFERTMTFIAQVAQVLNPEGFKKMQEASSKFRSFDDVAKCFIEITKSAVGKKTNLKLIGKVKDGNVVAGLPKFVAVNKKGEKFTCDNFLGDKLFFSAYEESRRKEYHNAKPTEMPSQEVNIDSLNVDSKDIDFNSIL